MVEPSFWSMGRKKRNWLISYPRSGNTWIRLFFEYYTRKSTRSLCVPFKPLIFDTVETILWKKHELFFDGPVDESDKVVFLIRNPFDAIASSLKFDGKEPSDSNVKKYVKHYVEEINEYEKFNGKKIIIYYEDLLDDFKETVKKIIVFLELKIKERKIDKFMKKNEKYFRRALSWYVNEVPDKTKDNVYGDKDFFMRHKDLSNSQISFIHSKIKNHEYLERYKWMM